MRKSSVPQRDRHGLTQGFRECEVLKRDRTRACSPSTTVIPHDVVSHCGRTRIVTHTCAQRDVLVRFGEWILLSDRQWQSWLTDEKNVIKLNVLVSLLIRERKTHQLDGLGNWEAATDDDWTREIRYRGSMISPVTARKGPYRQRCGWWTSPRVWKAAVVYRGAHDRLLKRPECVWAITCYVYTESKALPDRNVAARHIIHSQRTIWMESELP